METIWKQYENDWKHLETIWKLYGKNMERMWKGCGNNMEMKWNFLSVTGWGKDCKGAVTSTVGEAPMW